jgi:hypothetical protein
MILRANTVISRRISPPFVRYVRRCPPLLLALNWNLGAVHVQHHPWDESMVSPFVINSRLAQQARRGCLPGSAVPFRTIVSGRSTLLPHSQISLEPTRRKSGPGTGAQHRSALCSSPAGHISTAARGRSKATAVRSTRVGQILFNKIPGVQTFVKLLHQDQSTIYVTRDPWKLTFNKLLSES